MLIFMLASNGEYFCWHEFCVILPHISLVEVKITLLIVHPCDQGDKGGCEDVCNINGDQAVCSCSKPGYQLHSDGKKCG